MTARGSALVPETVRLRALLDRVARRRLWTHAVTGAAAGLVAGSVAAAALRVAEAAPGGWAVFIALLGLVAGVAIGLARLRRAPSPAALVERVRPARNVVITAAELLERPGRTSAYVGAAVQREAARAVDGLVAADVAPARRAVVLAIVAVVASALVLAASADPTALPVGAPFAGAEPGIAAYTVEVEPPAYIGGESRTLEEPARVEALAGSAIRVRVVAMADAVTLETLAGKLPLEPEVAVAGDASPEGGLRRRGFVGTAVAGADGFLAIEAVAGGATVDRRFAALTVVPDAAPRVRIVEPANDLRLPSGDRTIALAVDAEDDHALASLRVVYTKVTGFGERFTFLEGTVPVQVERADERHWSARASWPLAPLGLDRGDIVVYRAVAADRRPGAAPAESDTYVIEVIGADAATTGGYAGEEELDRYALSQQMVIVLTERLIARRDSLPAARLAEEARTLAAAQRTVRAGFVFMLGGELGDEGAVETNLDELHEEAHARADADVLEGRLANRGRLELARAIQAMSHAVTLLGGVELDEALRAEQTALTFLQRAFSSSRYILRALNERERLDLSRRLTGALAAAVRDTRPAPAAPEDPLAELLRRAIAAAARLAADDDVGADSLAAGASALALEVARIEPGSEPFGAVAALLTDAAAAAARDASGARDLIAEAAARLAELLRARVPAAPAAARPAGLGRLDGALWDALRTGAGPR